MKPNINRWIFEIPLNDVRNEGVSCTNRDDCLLCGKPIKSIRKQVHLLTNGNLVSTDQEFSGSEDRGFWPIGADCAKRLPNNFIF